MGENDLNEDDFGRRTQMGGKHAHPCSSQEENGVDTSSSVCAQCLLVSRLN